MANEIERDTKLKAKTYDGTEQGFTYMRDVDWEEKVGQREFETGLLPNKTVAT